MNEIPTIDLNGALSIGGPRATIVAAELRRAAMSSGFFYVRNHGVPNRMVESQFETARQLLNLPVSTREALSMHNSPSLRGYERIGEQTLDLESQPDLKESFYCGMRYPDDHPYVLAGYQTYGANQWPTELPDAPTQCEDYIQAMLTLARRLMQLMALSLGIPEGYFDTATESPMVTLRMLRYPPHPKDATAKTFGAGAHTDWGALTILAQDSHGGLEVAMPEGNWIAATRYPTPLWSIWAT